MLIYHTLLAKFMKTISELIKEELDIKERAYHGLPKNSLVIAPMFIVSFKKTVLTLTYSPESQ